VQSLRARIHPGDLTIAVLLLLILLIWSGSVSVAAAAAELAHRAALFLLLVGGPCAFATLFLLMTNVELWKLIWGALALGLCLTLWITPWNERQAFFAAASQVRIGMSRNQVTHLFQSFERGASLGTEVSPPPGASQEDLVCFHWTDERQFGSDMVLVTLHHERVVDFTTDAAGRR
jgi:hypothetical protein